jgi:CubicO group peptidase (beta-lactamase class C family)
MFRVDLQRSISPFTMLQSPSSVLTGDCCPMPCIRPDWPVAILRHIFIWAALTAGPLIAAPSWLRGQPAPVDPTESPRSSTTGTYQDQLSQAIDEHFAKRDLPGLAVLYAKDGEVAYQKMVGFADVAGNVPMTEDKVGRLNSVSKWVAAIVSLQAVEQGKLDLGATARSQIADLPEHHTSTLRDLLACRGGIRHYTGATSPASPRDWMESQYDTALAAAPQFWHDPLAVPVGKYHYSTHGYTILGACLERAFDRHTREIIRTQLSEPLDLPTLAEERLTDGNPQRMKFYTPTERGNREVRPQNSTWKVWGGGIESSPRDLLKLGILLGDGKIIARDNVQLLMTRLDPEESYCLGCNHTLEHGQQVMAKSGSFQGSNAYIWLVPERRMTMVIMANRDQADVTGLGLKLRSIVLAADKAAKPAP